MSDDQIKQIASLIKVYNFCIEHRDHYFNATAFTDRMSVLAQIADNYELFNIFNTEKCALRTTELSTILQELKNNKSLMAVHFADIDCYGLYTYENYQNLCTVLKSSIKHENIKNDLHIQQIIPENVPQKLIIICHESDYSLNILIEKCFITRVIRHNNEFLINAYCEDEDDINYSYNILYQYLDKNRSYLRDKIQIAPLYETQYGGYRKYNISLSVENSIELDLAILLGTFDGARVKNDHNSDTKLTTEWILVDIPSSNTTSNNKSQNNLFSNMLFSQNYIGKHHKTGHCRIKN